MNYSVSKSTARLIEAVDVLVKANSKVLELLDTVYPEEATEAYEEAMAKTQDELLNLLKSKIQDNLYTLGRSEEVTEI